MLTVLIFEFDTLNSNTDWRDVTPTGVTMTISKNQDGARSVPGITASSDVMTAIRAAKEVIVITSNDGQRVGNQFYFYNVNKGRVGQTQNYMTEDLTFFESITISINFNSGGVLTAIYHVGSGWNFTAPTITKIYVR